MLWLCGAAVAYPYFLRVFYTFQVTGAHSVLSTVLAVLFMAAAFAVPAIGLFVA
jgi:hypothetical protein